MGLVTVRCRDCKEILGNRVGPYFVAAWSHREYVVRGLSFLTCGRCGTDWSPRPIGRRDHRPVLQIAQESSAAPLLCLTPNCRRILAQVGTVGAPCAIVAYGGRQIVGDALAYASCDRCRTGFEPPFPLAEICGAPASSLSIPAAQAV